MAVHSYWTKKLQDAGKKMSTLKYLGLDYCSTDTSHHCYNLPTTDPLLITIAEVKCKVLVQRYPLTAINSAGKNNVALENLQHFVFICRSIQHKQDSYIKHVQDVLHSNNYTFPQLTNNLQDWYTHLLLDSKVLT